jgi:hypothetical protein
LGEGGLVGRELQRPPADAAAGACGGELAFGVRHGQLALELGEEGE